MCYVRGESKFSDHRPVYSLFTVEVDLRLKKLTPTAARSSCAAKVQAEELLLPTRAQSFIDTAPRLMRTRH
ncbi:hypothetical protein L6164_009879 [Bauhinia variegata]|nr:hypothetical protein L6164_009879 [Bauhinia variegata]